MFEDETSARDTDKFGIAGNFLDRLGPPEWCEARFGPGYVHRRFDKRCLAAFIQDNLFPPTADAGITFTDFVIPEDAGAADSEYMILCALDMIGEHLEAYVGENGESALSLFNLEIDLLRRFVPIFVSGWNRPLFHAYHLYDVLDWIHPRPEIAMLLTKPSDTIFPYL